MKENKILVDASFVAKLLGLSGEKEQQKCQHLVEESVLLSPSLLSYEIGSISLKYASQRDTLEILEIFSDLHISLFDPRNLSEIADIAQKNALSYYDASYIAILLEHSDIDAFFTYDSDFKNINDSRIRILKNE